MAGASLKTLVLPKIIPKHWAIKESVFPFSRFPGSLLSLPLIRSTGELMGQDKDFGIAYAEPNAASRS